MRDRLPDRWHFRTIHFPADDFGQFSGRNNFKDVPSFTVDVVEVDQSNLIDVVVNEYAYHSLEDLG